ncbi:MAG: ABC-type multidrug transport system, ATPase component [Ilumatobacteraceae bacterium]|nr:ABC-type multidrug transport system, ATPase component [Ilumatobacteraceae bacterium]
MISQVIFPDYRQDMVIPLIVARDLRKNFDTFEAVRGLDFDVQPGEAFGLLGPNGAGKSSTMRMLAAVSPPTSGTLRILGMDPATQGSEIRARLGVVPQDDTLDSELTVRENLIVYGRYFGLSRRVLRERADELLEFAQLTDRRDERVERLSGGMRRRLTIARALVNRPDIVLLDEPTTGLDPQARHVLWERLYQLRREGVTLVLTTHYMDEAEQLCDRLLIVDKGVVAAEGTPRELIVQHSTREVLEVRHDGDEHLCKLINELGADLDVIDGVGRVEMLPERALVYTDDGDATADLLSRSGVSVHRLYVRRSTLEDVFLRLSGRTLVD